MVQHLVYSFNDLNQVALDLGIPQEDIYLKARWDTIRHLLGGKGANLFRMVREGVRVPTGMTITTKACRDYSLWARDHPEESSEQWFNTETGKSLWKDVESTLRSIELSTGREIGSGKQALLLSVRSGAAVSMPGMMDTVLNLGMSDQILQTIEQSGSESAFRNALDCYVRLICIYGEVVDDLDIEILSEPLQNQLKMMSTTDRNELSIHQWTQILDQLRAIYQRQTGRSFPQDPHHQLKKSILAVFKSWDSERAQTYRTFMKIPSEMGTAVTIQVMVFGNADRLSCTGVVFSRNPSTGTRELFGDFLPIAQGEDIVAGIRTPLKVQSLLDWNPESYHELNSSVNRLEQHFKDMQDIEFTIERGSLYILQTRSGKRTAEAGVRIPFDMADEGLITIEDAVLQLNTDQLKVLMHPSFDPVELKKAEKFVSGINASPGAGTGQIVFDPDTAVEQKAKGISVVLVREETKADDVHGMLSCEALLTAHGGATSHAAVVCRQFSVPAVCGAGDLEIDRVAKTVTNKETGRTLKEGDLISIDGTSGVVYLHRIATRRPDITPESLVARVIRESKKHCSIDVKANADSPQDVQLALLLGASGIGLCRTEHMFFSEDRVTIMRRVIMAEPGSESERHGLKELEDMQYLDFLSILNVLKGRPFCVRLLDPPLHEFLPSLLSISFRELGLKIANMPKEIVQSAEAEKKAVEALIESNPMLGFRGCRVAIERPAILEMQTRALFRAALASSDTPNIEIMIPVVCAVEECTTVRSIIDVISQEMDPKRLIPYKVGSMIELPRACLIAGDLSDPTKGRMEFFSFGTNDLTQTTFGISRDDAERHFLNNYIEKGLLPTSPFVTIDEPGVGALIEIAIAAAKKRFPAIRLSICGEHGGDPDSIEYFCGIGVDALSCSSYRVPLAILRAAQVKLSKGKQMYRANL